MKRLKSMNGTCIAQDEASSVVFGMPKAVIDAGIANAVIPLEEIANNLNMVLSNERVLRRASV